jgi:AcrR family transcriptional regulator
MMLERVGYTDMSRALKRRRYRSEFRTQAAENTRKRILEAARTLFSRRGIDKVTIAEIADKAAVAPSTVYAIYKSKEGMLRTLMHQALFGRPFEHARAKLDNVTDPIKRIALTAPVARAIYEQERAQLSFVRGASAFSPSLRKLEQEFENLRYELQEERIRLLFDKSRQRKNLTVGEARRLLWMYTSRDIYRMLVQEGGWTADRYEQWLAETLIVALTKEYPSRHRK